MVFSLELLILAPLILGVDVPGVLPLYLLVSPAIALFLLSVNLALAQNALRSLTLSPETRRNHALEHATVLLLATDTGGVSGRSEDRGFFVSGAGSADRVRGAFLEIAGKVESGQPFEYISKYCGSNRVTVLAFAALLLAFVTAWTLLFRPSLGARTLALLVVVLAFATTRHFVGNWLQRSFYTSTDFERVELVSIREVPTRRLWERGPSFFLETRIVPTASPSERSAG